MRTLLRRALGVVGTFILLGSVAVSPRGYATEIYYSPKALAQRFGEQFHPLERPRGEAYLESLKRAGRNVACAVLFGTYANSLIQPHPRIAKGFHNGSIGWPFEGAVVKFELLPNRPQSIRHGLFSESMPSEIIGVANFTTGRSDESPWELMPDVTGLSLGLVVKGKWTVLTMTGSKGAFGDTVEDFSHLASYSAIGAKIVGRISGERARNVIYALQERRLLDDSGFFFPGLKRAEMKLGGSLGEGGFIARHPIVGLGTLTPAVLSGRRSPFFGYKNIGFGSGHAYLLDEAVPMEERTAFRFGMRLAGAPYNGALRESLPGWWNTLTRATIGGEHRHLSQEFQKRIQEEDIVYEFYVQLEDKEHPRRTSIEKPSRKWRTEPIVVARVTLLKKSPKLMSSETQVKLSRVVTHMPFNPGFGWFIPLGDLGYGRSVGPVMDDIPGAYWASERLRRAQGFGNEGGLDEDRLREWMADISQVFGAHQKD